MPTASASTNSRRITPASAPGATNARIVLRLDLDREKPEAESVTSVWKGAEWQEREVYDLMGVAFKGNPDLRRILLPDDWEGYPLRKDYVIPD